MVIYKQNVINELKNKGYTSYKIRREKIMGERQFQDIRNRHVTMGTLDTLCALLHCQPGDILEWVPDEAD